MEVELPQRLQQLIDGEEARKAETEHNKKELEHIRLCVSEAKKGLTALHGVEVGHRIASEIERKIDERGLALQG